MYFVVEYTFTRGLRHQEQNVEHEGETKMKAKRRIAAAVAIALLFSMPITSQAAGWKQEADGRICYLDDQGNMIKNGWMECAGRIFYLGEDGYILVNTVTPDGMLVGADGAFIGVAPIEPQMSTVTSKPKTVIKEGTYKVGAEIVAGEYMLMSTDQFGGYYSVNSDSTGSFESIVKNGLFTYNAIISVEDGQYLTLQRCTLSPMSEMPLISYAKGTMFKIGYNLPAGEYKLQSTSAFGGYCAVLKGLGGGIDDIVSNKIMTGQDYVTVEDGQYLQLSGSEIVEKTK